MTPLSRLALERARRAWVRRHEQHFPLRVRWFVYWARGAAHRRSWREVWQDVIYLVRG